MKAVPLVLAAALCLAAPGAAADPAPPPPAPVECVPPPGGKCLSKEQFDEVKKALEELDRIHKSPAVLTTDDKVLIVQDWDGRVYTNGGSTNPIRFKLKVGDTVDRDVAMTLPTQVYYRPRPPDPMFRLRIRAQAGLLVPQMVQSVGGDKQRFWDAGIGWDFFHLGPANLSLYTGVNSAGGGIGFDLTRNFGTYVGYSLVYDGLKSSLLTGVYFSFN